MGIPSLSGLSVSGASLSPAFASGTTVYVAELRFWWLGAGEGDDNEQPGDASDQRTDRGSSGVALGADRGCRWVPADPRDGGGGRGIKQSYTVVVVATPERERPPEGQQQRDA